MGPELNQHHRTGSAHEPPENTMANLFWTIVPLVVTFSVAAWHSPSTNDTRKSTTNSCCENIG